MKNFVQPGEVVTLPAPTGGILAGVGILVGSIFGVAATTQDEGVDVEVALRGVFDMAKATGIAVTQGDPLYWDATAKKLTPDGDDGANKHVAVALSSELSGATTVRALLTGGFGAASAANVADFESRISALEA